MRILATADWQLNMLGGKLDPKARDYLSSQRVDTIDQLLSLATKEDVDAVLAAGDRFEYPSPSPEVVAAVAEVLQQHREIPIHAIPGNHDLYGPGTVWMTPEFQAISHFHLHTDTDSVELKDGVHLHPIPVGSRHAIEVQDERLDDVSADDFFFRLTPDEVLRAVEQVGFEPSGHITALHCFENRVHDVRLEDGTHIVMAHGHDLDYMNFDHEDCKLPLHSRRLIEKGYSLGVLGHWHSWKQVSDRVLYPGTHEQTKFGESDAGCVAIIDIADGTAAPVIKKHRVGQVRWSQESFDCTGEALPEALEAFVREQSTTVDFLELTLTGEVAVDASIDALPRAEIACAPMLKHLTWVNKTSSVIDVDVMTKNVELPHGLRNIQQDLLQESQNAAGDDERVAKLRDELEALYRACRDVGVIREEERA